MSLRPCGPSRRRARRSRRSNRGHRRSAGYAAALVLLGGCTPSADPQSPPRGADTRDCSLPQGEPAPATLDEHLDLDRLVTWASIRTTEGSTNASGIAADATVAGVLVEVQRAAAQGGWEVFSLDDEGFEAELLARGTEQRSSGELLGVNLREGACPAQVLVAISVTDYAALS